MKIKSRLICTTVTCDYQPSICLNTMKRLFVLVSWEFLKTKSNMKKNGDKNRKQEEL